MAQFYSLLFNSPNRHILAVCMACYSFVFNNGTASNSTVTIAPAICNLSADETIAVCASSRTLSTDAGSSGYTWSTGSTASSITVNSSGTYYYEKIDLSKNSVANSDFDETGNGNRGFTSEYDYVVATASALNPEGKYSLPSSPRDVHNNFSDFPDHTGGGGARRMMVVNGASTANVKVWEQNINIEPNTTYIFSIWGASAHPSSPGNLKFSINGTQLGNIQLSASTGLWQNFTVQWTSGASTSATIAIVNQNTAATGNDFALDDIVFAPICRKNFHVTLNLNPPKPNIASQAN